MTAALKRAVPAAVAALVIGLIGLFGRLAGHPWLFASLGPTIVLQTTVPQLPMTRPWNVAVGQLVGLGAGFAAIYATGAMHAAPFLAGHSLTTVRVEAAALAIFLGIVLEAVLRASHAPAAATILLIALGVSPPTWSTVITLICGIALITALGELARLAMIRLGL
jgi:hypothetical protein